MKIVGRLSEKWVKGGNGEEGLRGKGEGLTGKGGLRIKGRTVKRKRGRRVT